MNIIGVVIADVARLMRTAFDRRVRKLGITRAQWLVLTRLHRHPGASQSELADMMEVEKASAGRMIDRLEARAGSSAEARTATGASSGSTSRRKPSGCTGASGASPRRRSTTRSPIFPRRKAPVPELPGASRKTSSAVEVEKAVRRTAQPIRSPPRAVQQAATM